MADAFTISKKWVFWVVVLSLLAFFIYAVKAILLPFVVGILVAYFLDPAADRLERWGCSRTLATLIITVLFFTGMILILVALLPALYNQFSSLLAELPALWRDVRELVESEVRRLTGDFAPEEMAKAKQAVSDASSGMVTTVREVTLDALRSGFALVNLLSLIVITPLVSFYLLRDWDRLVTYVDTLLPRDSAPIIREQVIKIDHTISGFVRGTLNVMLILGLFYAISLSLIGLDYAILIGLFGGFMIIIPYLGTFLSGVAAVGMAMLQFDSIAAIIAVFAVFAAGQMLEGYILTPKLVGDKVGLHPLWLIFGMLAGATLLGFVGVFLAVPVTAVIGVLVRFAIEQYRQSDYYDKA